MTSEFNEQAEKTVRTENGDQLSRCKALESVHHALVRANDHLPERLERVAHGGRQGRACRLFRSRNSFTRSGPNVTRPGPRAFGRKPVMLSFSVGSLKSALAVLERVRDGASAPPQQVHEHGAPVLHRERPLEKLELFDRLDRPADTP